MECLCARVVAFSDKWPRATSTLRGPVQAVRMRGVSRTSGMGGAGMRVS
jgi:hypothetical protein